jgi:hypothetical protein
MGLRTLLARVRRWFRPDTTRPAAARGVRPRFEELEARQVPAVLINDAYIASLYQGFLGRPAAVSDLVFWDNRISAGETRTQIAAEVVASPEFQGRELQLLFPTFLGRPLDQIGRDAWAPVLRNGGGLDQVKAGILGSQEYFVRNGNTLVSFLNAVYESQLGRPLDLVGQVFWVTRLGNGESRQQVAADILASDEASLVKTEGIYQEILGRPLDSAGAAFWVDVLHSGQPVENVFSDVAGSDEFFNLLTTSNNLTTLPDVNQVANEFLTAGGRFNAQVVGEEVLDRILPTDRTITTLPNSVVPTAISTTTTTPPSPIVTGAPSAIVPGNSTAIVTGTPSSTVNGTPSAIVNGAPSTTAGGPSSAIVTGASSTTAGGPSSAIVSGAPSTTANGPSSAIVTGAPSTSANGVSVNMGASLF